MLNLASVTNEEYMALGVKAVNTLQQTNFYLSVIFGLLIILGAGWFTYKVLAGPIVRLFKQAFK
jgi:hypothetical protein